MGPDARNGLRRARNSIAVDTHLPDQIDAWFASPSVVLLTETDAHWVSWRDLLQRSQAVGPVAHDARVAALCLQHDVSLLWTADRDFARFAPLKSVNPLVGR